MQNNMKGSGRQKLIQEIPKDEKKTTEKAKMSDLNCQIILKFEVSVVETGFSANI